MLLDGEMSERFKEPVLKTGDSKRAVGSNPTLSVLFFWNYNILITIIMEMYPSWWRGSPAKGVGQETGARVRISPSPLRPFKM